MQKIKHHPLWSTFGGRWGSCHEIINVDPAGWPPNGRKDYRDPPNETALNTLLPERAGCAAELALEVDAVIALIWDGLREHARSFVDSQLKIAVTPDRLEKLHRRDVVSVFAGKVMVTKERGMLSIYDHEIVSLHSRNDFFMVRKRKRDEDIGGRPTASRYYQNFKLSRPKVYPSCSAKEKSDIWQPYQIDNSTVEQSSKQYLKLPHRLRNVLPASWFIRDPFGCASSRLMICKASCWLI